MLHRLIGSALRRASSWAHNHQPSLITLGAALLLLALGVFDKSTGGRRREDILFLAQVGGVVFLVVYVVATNRIAQANQASAQATRDSAIVGKQAVEAALRSLDISQAMLAESRATRQAQEMQAAPRVVVYPELEGLAIYLTIENTGLSFANDVKVTFTPELPPNAFPSGFTPDFFTGALFTLKPGQKVRQPLAQDYRPPFNLNGSHPQMATARYRGGILSEHVSETFPINTRGFEKILVTQSDVDRALDKLDDLITAVKEAGQAVGKLSKQLDSDLLVSTTVVNQPVAWDVEQYLAYFAQLVAGLRDEWRLWRVSDNPSESSKHARERWVRGSLAERRFRTLLAAVLVTLPNLSVSADDGALIRSLLLDIQAAEATSYHSRDFDYGSAVTDRLDELSELVERLRQEGMPGHRHRQSDAAAVEASVHPGSDEDVLGELDDGQDTGNG